MKKIILGLAVLTVLFSCSNESKMKSEIKAYLDKNAKDQKSYEFVELKSLDPLTVGDYAKKRIAFNYENKKFNDSIVKNFGLYIDKIELDPFGENLNSPENQKEYFDDAKKQLIEIEVVNKILNKHIDSKDILIVKAIHSFRIKNGFGVLDLVNMYVFFNKDYKLLDMTKENYVSSYVEDSIFKANYK